MINGGTTALKRTFIESEPPFDLLSKILYYSLLFIVCSSLFIHHHFFNILDSNCDYQLSRQIFEFHTLDMRYVAKKNQKVRVENNISNLHLSVDHVFASVYIQIQESCGPVGRYRV